MGGEMWSGGNNRDLSRGVDDSNNSNDLSLEIAALTDLVQPQQYGISSTQQPHQQLPYLTPQTQPLTMAAGTAVYQPPLSSGGSLPHHGLLQHRSAPDFNVVGTTQSHSGSSQDDTASVESFLDIYQDTYQSTACGSIVDLSALGQFHLPVVTGSSSFSGTSYSVRSSSAHVSASDYPQQQIDEGRENRPFTPTNYQTIQQKELESFSQLLGQYEPVSTQGSERDTSEAVMQGEQCLGTGSVLVGGQTMAAKYTGGQSVNRSNLSGSSLHGVGVVSKDTAVTNISGMCESYPETSRSSSLTTSFTPPPPPLPTTTTCSIHNATWNTSQSTSFGDSFPRVTANRKRRLSGGSSQQQPSQLTGQSRRGGRTRIRSVSCGSAGAGIRDGEDRISDGQSFSPASEILLYPMGDNQDDDDRTLRRRERNRLAAQKCRQKKRDAAQGLFKQYQDLESSNTSLKYDIRVYRKQKEELEQMLAEHLKQCSNSVLRQRDSVTPHSTPASTSQRVRNQPARTHTLTSGGAVSISNAETSKARSPLVVATCTCQTATTSPARNITQQRPMNYSMPATRVAGPLNPANTGAGGDLSGSGSSSIPSTITALPVRDPEEIRTINQLISQSQHPPTAIRSDPGGTFQKHWSQDATPPTPNTASLSQNSSQFNLAVSSRGVDSSIGVNLQRRASQTYPHGNSNAPLVIPPPSLAITSSPAYSQSVAPAVSETATAVVTTTAGDSNQQSAGQYDTLLQQIRQLQQGGNQAGQYDPT